MKFYIYSVIFLVLFATSCNSIRYNRYNRIYNEYDNFKQQEKRYIEFQTYAYALNRPKWDRIYATTMFEKIDKPNEQRSKILFFINLGLDLQLEKDFYIKTDSILYKCSFDTIKETVFHNTNTSQETKIIKDKKDNNDDDDNAKETIIHSSDTNTYEFKKVKSEFTLSPELIDNIKVAQVLQIRYYINDKAYDLFFKPKQVEKIQMLFSEQQSPISKK